MLIPPHAHAHAAIMGSELEHAPPKGERTFHRVDLGSCWHGGEKDPEEIGSGGEALMVVVGIVMVLAWVCGGRREGGVGGDACHC